MKLIYILLLLIITSSVNAKDTNSSLEILRPIEKTMNIGELSTFVMKIDSNLSDIIVITQDNGNISDIEIIANKNTYCKTLKLHPGENTITVDLHGKDRLLSSIEKKIYFFSELFEGSEDEAEENDYEKKYFHKNDNEESCKKCHDMSSNVPTNGDAFEDVSKTTCFECHKSLMGKSNTHAPAANWLCLECHNGKTGEYNMDKKGVAKYIVRDPVAKTCAECHDTVDGWFNNLYTHGPTNDGRCVRCHNPHGSDNEFFLRKPVWDLCTTCHSEKATGKHVIPAIGFGSSPTAGGHPTKDRMDPVRKGRKFYCSSCHNPHGSSGVYLLRMKGSFTFNVCQRCHPK